ncbi:phosphoribosyl-ATP pyrophosphatase [Zymomonas mobilis subsp. pomaceae]|uniref:Phosphoribosyl-ATP pyrophosphatase n=2 Tax=Zymomonas mobilis TaxID=542 RepID=F8EW76_ZYMMT|nr:phosphoribosyl-ATP diphosphatase [Zymomonas mobilis subsp. pomaceae ATCC 29192]GEB89885.1 phosphoribosyl-ATP pyrophosphatase [Zymomonas mobilis subsp. pomaceae]
MKDKPAMSQNTLAYIESVIAERRKASPEESYVSSLFHRGTAHIAQKLGEEAVETVIAALSQDKKSLESEAADLLFHLAVLLTDRGTNFDNVFAVLQSREGTSGHAEKAARKNKK